MTKFRKTGERGHYAFLDEKCIGRECWSPGEFHTRAAGGSGSRATGAKSLCCMCRAYHGCPSGPDGRRTEEWDGREVTIAGKPEFDPLVATMRRAQGWKVVR